MWSNSDIFLSMQKKALVIRHLYNEDGANIPEDTLSTVTDVNEAFDVCDLKDTEIKIHEEKVPEIKSEQQVRMLFFFDRCWHFLLWCIYLKHIFFSTYLKHINFRISLDWELWIMTHYHYYHYLRISKSCWT